MSFALHHVSIPVRDIARAAEFYGEVLGLPGLERPGFPFDGRWFGTIGWQVHLIVHDRATFRPRVEVDPQDIHFALRTEDFDGALARLEAAGYGDTLPRDHPKWLRVKRAGVTGFAQAFLCDPDGNIVEINGAPG